VSASGQLDCKMNAKLSGAMGAMTSVIPMGGFGSKNSQGIPFKITGTTSNPIFLPDVAGMASSMAKGAISTPGSATDAASGVLGGLFGKKKKN